MGECFLYGNSSTNGVNLKITWGVSRPASARHNAIWVNTDSVVTNYVVLPHKPESPSTGTLFISTTGSGIEMFIDKKNRVSINLAAVSLWNGTSWDYLDAYLYTDDGWTQFSSTGVDLYNMGNQCSELTGGWKITNHSGGTSTLESDYIKFSCKMGESNLLSNIHTIKKISIAAFSTLCINWDVTALNAVNSSIAYADFGLGADTGLQGGKFTARTRVKEIGTFTTKVDISSVADNYVVIYTRGIAGKIHRVWLER